MSTPETDHEDCVKVLAEFFSEAWQRFNPHEPRVEAVISTMTPLVMNPYLQAFTCPHGVRFWIEPTTEQIADWAERGVK